MLKLVYYKDERFIIRPRDFFDFIDLNTGNTLLDKSGRSQLVDIGSDRKITFNFAHANKVVLILDLEE